MFSGAGRSQIMRSSGIGYRAEVGSISVIKYRYITENNKNFVYLFNS
jgi:hypothetical protein